MLLAKLDLLYDGGISGLPHLVNTGLVESVVVVVVVVVVLVVDIEVDVDVDVVVEVVVVIVVNDVEVNSVDCEFVFKVVVE